MCASNVCTCLYALILTGRLVGKALSMTSESAVRSPLVRCFQQTHTHVHTVSAVCCIVSKYVINKNGPENRPELSTILHELHWLPVQSRIAFKLATITYKILTTAQPNYICTLLKYYTAHHTLHSANQHLEQPWDISTELSNRSFSYLAPRIWNNLRLKIKTFSYD